MTTDKEPCCSPAPRQGTTSREPPITAGQPVTDLVAIRGGCFLMGSDVSPHPEDGECPAREVEVSDFYIARFATTHLAFSRFVQETDYRTDAEEAGGAWVFSPNTEGDGERLPHAPWWLWMDGACWRDPYADNQQVENDHPVVQVSHNDARAYAYWAGTRLPTEAEWEYAARGGLDAQPFPWGSELTINDEHQCNIWQGEFPTLNSGEDGYLRTAPVNCFRPNGYGLYNMTGNTWEWVADRFSRIHDRKRTTDPQGPLSGERFVTKGGSFLCHDSYCSRYRASSRTANLPNACAVHIGFRVARSFPIARI